MSEESPELRELQKLTRLAAEKEASKAGGLMAAIGLFGGFYFEIGSWWLIALALAFGYLGYRSTYVSIVDGPEAL